MCPWAGRGAARRCSSRRRAAAWRQSFSTAEGRLIYAARKSVAEPPFGWIKHVMGLGALQRKRLNESAGGVGPGVPGAQRPAAKCGGGSLNGGDGAWLGAGPAAIDSIRAGRALDTGADWRR